RQADREHRFRRNLTHAGLCDVLCNASSHDLIAFCEGIPGMRSSAGKLLGNGGTGQALGILAEVVRQAGRIGGALCGDSPMEDSVGVCDLLGGGSVVRLEHDVSSASASPMLMAIIELYLKGAMEAGSSRRDAPHYVVLEEMGTLPKISQLPAALTYGRSRGLSLTCCAQSVSQIAAAYGHDDASTVLGGFQTLIAFGTNDAGTRKELASRYGDNVIERSHVGASGKIESKVDRQPVIADWHVSSLRVGEAIVCPPLPNPPYRFLFDRSV
ncbi:MAG: TraM recognition domain-containing protein, partial [Eggerthellaceae bacterium]|nr:TraM recognition domain-containing protein [Eggerthellaceae bacterium]